MSPSAEELRLKQEEASFWRTLTESSAWGQLKAIMEEQRRIRLFTVAETPLQSFAEAMPQEFMKGEAAGIGLVLTLPYTQLELAKADMAILEVKLEQEQEDEITDAETDAGKSRVELGGDSPFGE